MSRRPVYPARPELRREPRMASPPMYLDPLRPLLLSLLTSRPKLLTPVFATDPRDHQLSPLLATLPKTPFHKSFLCHTCDPLPRFSVPSASLFDIRLPRASRGHSPLATSSRLQSPLVSSTRVRGRFLLLTTANGELSTANPRFQPRVTSHSESTLMQKIGGDMRPVGKFSWRHGGAWRRL